MAVADARQRILRPVNARRRPPVIEGAPRSSLMAEHRSAVVEHVNSPPADVGAKKGDIAATRDEALHGVAHGFAPILVVTDVQEQLVSVDTRRVVVQIEIGAEIDVVLVLGEPAGEAGVPMRERLASGRQGIRSTRACPADDLRVSSRVDPNQGVFA